MSKVRKALVGTLSAATSAIVVAAQDGAITTAEWVTVALAAVAAGYAVWQVPNATPPASPAPGMPSDT